MGTGNSASPLENLHYFNGRKEILLGCFFFLLLAFSSIFLLFNLHSLDPFRSVTAIVGDIEKVPPTKHSEGGNNTVCNLFSGRWVRDPRGPGYTNRSCVTLPDSKNCDKYGKNMDHVNWRWKPDGCEMPRFDPETFLRVVRGKTMAFIGDSLARNQMESLLCLLSQVEAPTSIYMDRGNRFRTWYFPSHNFTLMVMWARFLVAAKERLVNGSTFSGVFDIHLDKIDTDWAEELPRIHYVVISGGQWFLRKTYLYKNDTLIGCTLCSEANIPQLSIQFVIQSIIRTSLQFINTCENCDGIQTFLRTFSPTHFENGKWNNGGYCNRTWPSNEGEVSSQSGFDHSLLLRKVQVEEISRVVREGEIRGKKRFGVLDVTKAMLMRVDGHPGSHWNHEWGKGNNDCLHWCLPGPIDLWNELLLMELKKSL